MHWSDERYVKLYSRDTPGWMLWPWQARALLPLLLRRLDGAGVLECGRAKPMEAVAIVVGLPLDVVSVGLEALLADGVLESIERGLLMPNYIEAQEATKTEATKKRHQRERHRAQAREVTKLHVPECPVVSPSVPECPPPAQPSPAQPIPAYPSPTTKKTAPAAPTPRKSDRLMADFLEIIGSKYQFAGEKDAVALAALLKANTLDEVSLRWRRGLASEGWKGVRTIAQLRSKWNDLAQATVLDLRKPVAAESVDWSKQQIGEVDL